MSIRTKLRIWLTVLLSTLGVCCSTAQAKTIFVNANSASGGDGTSWPTAYKYLQDALSAAVYDDQIWVAAGTYKPTKLTDPNDPRTATFQMINGVPIYGGFPDTGNPDMSDRDPNIHETILSGDLFGNDITDPNKTENSYHVVTASYTDPNTILDGFIITAGNANVLESDNRGAGIYNESGDLQISNCKFLNNSAGYYYFGIDYVICYPGDAGGMYNALGSSPELTNCTFMHNSANGYGGGIYNINSNLKLNNCSFIANSSTNSGGGLYIDSGTATMSNCTFTSNSSGFLEFVGNDLVLAVGEGGGIYNYDSSPIIIACNFIDNFALSGGGICNDCNSCPVITGCTFSGNETFGSGGGMHNSDESNPLLDKCIFTENIGVCRVIIPDTGSPVVIEAQGGGISNYLSNPTLNQCSFLGNLANGGGGMFNRDSSPILTSCSFRENSANDSGGAITNYQSNPILISINFVNNNAENCGGGLYNIFSNPAITNSLFAGNRARSVVTYTDRCGAGMYNTHSNPVVANSVFVGNLADGVGSVILSEYSNPVIDNCIIRDNKPLQFCHIVSEGGGTTTIRHSNVEGGEDFICLYDTSLDWAEGNIDAEPCFVDPGYWDPNDTPTDPIDDFWVDGDYHLQPSSPCIDAGDPCYITGPGDVDKDGNPRIVDGDGDGIARIDMGAYEFQLYCGGKGTAEEPYLICAPVHIQQIGANPDDWDKCFKLTADIDLSGYVGVQFNIIGWYEDGLNNEPFTGVFDGNGHTISSFTYTAAGQRYVGLFGYVAGQTAQIKGLGIIDPNVTSTGGISIGTLAGCIGNGTTVSDCHVKGGTIAGNKMVGGLAGRAGNAIVSRCSADCDVTGIGWGVGGLMGDAWQTTISECYATGNVSAENWGVGGLIGHQYDGQILTSYSTGTVNGIDNGIGGFVGNAERVYIEDCYTAGAVQGVDEAGGFVGKLIDSDIIASFWDTSVSGQAVGIGYDESNGTVELYPKTTTQMRLQSTFTDHGWDFAGESANGSEDAWTIWEDTYYPRLTCENPITGDFTIDDNWMYQNLPGATNSTLTATLSGTADPLNNNSYTYCWENVLPQDVSVAPSILSGGLSGDAFCTFAAPACNQPGGISDSGKPFHIRLTVTGNDHGNTGIAQAEFGIALLGDVNNDSVVNVVDRSIINAFWRMGSAGPFSFKECDINCDSIINQIDRGIANAVWRGLLGEYSTTGPCPLR